MDTIDKEKFRLTAEEAEFIKDLIIKNEYIIRAEIRAALQEHFAQIGEDCISEVYLLACRKIKVLKNHTAPDAWIIVAAQKVAQSEARKLYMKINSKFSEIPQDLPMKNDTFEEALYNIWLDNHSLEKLFDLLTQHEKDVYDLLYNQRLTSKQAAEIMNVSDSTIRNIHSMIKKKIKNGIDTELF